MGVGVALGVDVDVDVDGGGGAEKGKGQGGEERMRRDIEAARQRLQRALREADDVERETMVENERLRRVGVVSSFRRGLAPGDHQPDQESGGGEDELESLRKTVEFARNFISMEEQTNAERERDALLECERLRRENDALEAELSKAFGGDAVGLFL